MAKSSNQNRRDRRWAENIRKGDREAFERLFRAYADSLCSFAAQHVNDATVAEDIVQDVFCDIWNRRAEWHPQGSVKAYLFRAVRNTALDHLKHRRVEQEWEEEEQRDERRRDRRLQPMSPVDSLQNEELKQAMQQAVEELPERRRTVYRMARHHDMSYEEIASALDISRNTVENHMGRALKELRGRLAKFAAFLQ